MKEAQKKRLIAMVGAIAGIVIFIGGILTIFGAFRIKDEDLQRHKSVKSEISTLHQTYGGDAYTGIQNAAADASNNAKMVAENVAVTNKYLEDVENSMMNVVRSAKNEVRADGLMLIGMGAFMFCYFALKFLDFDEYVEYREYAEDDYYDRDDTDATV